jgi:hypothetical protein
VLTREAAHRAEQGEARRDREREAESGVEARGVLRWLWAAKTAVVIGIPKAPSRRCGVLFASEAMPMSCGATASSGG